MSTDVISQPVAAEALRDEVRPRTGPVPGLYAAIKLASPLVAALAALAVHLFVPARQLPPMSWVDELPGWRHPYPLLLMILLGGAAAVALAQWLWKPLRAWALHMAPLLAGAIGVLVVWDLLTFKLNWMVLPYFPGPDFVFSVMIEDWRILMQSAKHSLLLLASGYLTGVTAGLVSGVLIGWFPRVRYWAMPALRVVGPIPATALIPLVMTLSSKSFICGTALIGFAVWFPVTMLTASGISNVRLSYLDVARTLGAGRMFLIFRVAIPAALPHIFIGLFMGLGASFLTLVVAETVGVQAGLGWYVKWQQGYVEYGKVYAALLIMAVFFSSIMTLLFKARDWVLAWQKGVIRW